MSWSITLGTMSKLNPPAEFDFTKPSGWMAWRERFMRFRSATQLSKKDGQTQIDTLVYTMGPEAENVFKTFSFARARPAVGSEPAYDEKQDFDVVIKKFDQYFIPKINTVHERAKFNARVQGADESVEQFIRSLYVLAENCKYDNKDEAIRDRIVTGIVDTKVSLDLQRKGDSLTLAQAIESVRQAEMLAQCNAQGTPSNRQELNYVSSARSRDYSRGRPRTRGRGRGRGADSEYRGTSESSRGQGRGIDPEHRDISEGSRGRARGATRGGHGPTPQNSKCIRCHQAHQAYSCPAFNRHCNLCGVKGHFRIACPNKYEQVYQVDDNAYAEGTEFDEYHESYSGNDFYLGSVETTDVQNVGDRAKVHGSDSSWVTQVKVMGTVTEFKIDTGADVTLMSESDYHKLERAPQLMSSATILSTPAGVLKHSGYFMNKFTVRGCTYSHRVFVVQGLKRNLLSGNVADKMGLVKRLHEIKQKSPDYGKIKCPPVKIKLKEDAVPYSVNVPRRVPIHLMSKVEDELMKLEQNGIIEQVMEPTEWCAPMVPNMKKNGDVRICVDLGKLSKCIVRERFIIPSIDEMLPKLAGSKFFTTLDAHSGFYQILLDEESRNLTTFITPLGRFRFCRLPFGISSATERFQRTMSSILKDIPGVIVYVDDILVHGAMEVEHNKRLSQVLHALTDAGVKLNQSKCKYKQSSLDYFGHVINGEGLSPSKEKVKAIIDLAPPKDVPGLRQIIGMVQYLGRYIPNLAQVMQPLNELLRADSVWCWDTAQQNAFDEVKRIVSQEPVLVFYDVNKPTVVSADACRYGLGGALWQQHPEGLKPVAYFSRTMTNAEKKYSQIEKECLASTCACEKFYMYLVGLENFRLITDHKPLVTLINDKDLDEIPIRCQSLLMCLMRFNAKAEYLPGKNLLVTDALSRHPVNEVADCEGEQDMEACVRSVAASWPLPQSLISKIKLCAMNDNTLKLVTFYVQNGWPKHSQDLPEELLKYGSERASLSVTEGLLTHGSRIVVPEVLRHELLGAIHEGHQGQTKCKERAKMSVWWPGIMADIARVTKSCSHCQIHKPAQAREPLISTPLPSGPWRKLGMDLCSHKGRDYLVVVDYYSRFPEILNLDSTTSTHIIAKLGSVFARFGYPDEIVSDNGGQLASAEIESYLSSCDITHKFSSPYFPESNGQSERYVHVAKSILCQKDPVNALLVYRSTPHSVTGFPPAQLLMGRNLKTRLPMLSTMLKPQWPDLEVVRSNDERGKANNEFYYNERYNVKPLPKLFPNDTVRMKTDKMKLWSNPMRVVSDTPHPRSYVVQSEEGRSYVRNRRHLQLVPDAGMEATAEPPVQQQVPPTPSVPPESPVKVRPRPTGIQPERAPPTPVPLRGTEKGTPLKTTRSGRLIKPVVKPNM